MDMDPDGLELKKIIEFSEPGGKRVLEVGCGDGRVSAMLAPLVGSLVAIDPDGERLEKAGAKVPGVDFRQGSGEALEFSGGAFDTVVFTFSLHHQNAARALGEAHRVLRHGGQALVIEPAPHGDMHRLFSLFKHEDVEIEAARKAVRNGMFSHNGGETFDIEYVFNDVEEVYDYFFGNYGITGDDDYMEKINEVLETRIKERPIRLFEAVNIFSLLKI